MDILKRIDTLLNNENLADLNDFAELITKELQKEPYTLWQQTFNFNGEQLTILKYLILKHNGVNFNLIEHINFLVTKNVSLFDGLPLNWALKHHKYDLVDLLLNKISGASFVVSAPESEEDTPMEASSSSYVQVIGGLGVDVMLTAGLFLRAEWEYVRFASSVDTQINTVRAGLGYKF